MAYNEEIAGRVRSALRERSGVTEKRMFGGLAFMLRGHMCVGVVRDNLMARVGPKRYADALRRPGAREMDFTGKPMKGFVFVAPEGIASDAALQDWITECISFVESLPAKQ